MAYRNLYNLISEIDFKRIRRPFFGNSWFKIQGIVFHAHAAKPFYDTHPSTGHGGNVTTLFDLFIVIV